MVTWIDDGIPGGWVTATPYVPQDTVTEISIAFRCVLTHVSNTEPDWASPPVVDPDDMTDPPILWQGVAFWQANRDFYAIGDLVVPTTPNGHVYRATAGGVSAGTEPTWPTAGGTVTDGVDYLVDPDATDNDTGTGDFLGAIESTLLFQVWPNPALDRDAAPLGVLTKASDRQIRVVFNNCGEGSFTINRHETEAAWLEQDNIVVVYRETLDNAPFFAFILETKEQVAVSPDEDGGDEDRWKGRGVMALLERAVLWYRSVLPNGADLGALPQDDRDGMWHWLHKRGIAILVRCLEEARQRGTFYGTGVQDCAIPNVYWDFGRGIDSASDPVDNDNADKFKLPVGDNLFAEAIPKLMQIGLLLRALPVVNGDGNLRTKLSSWVNDPGVTTGITFTKGVNIVESGEKLVDAIVGYTDVLVQGDLDDEVGVYTYRVRDDDTFRTAVGRREGFLPFQATPTTALLDRAGDRLIRQGKRRHDGPTTLEVLERTNEVAFVDYFPGDYVTVDIPGVWDLYEDNVDEILMTEDSDTGFFHVGIQFASDDPVGVVGISVDNCACSSEPVEVGT